ncbi:hypothetical protein LOCC1_G007990, partial [Lachnellula occidentalis]
MTSNTPTITDIKTSFLRTQMITLSQPLRPSSSPLPVPETDGIAPLRQRAIDDALLKLNAQLKKHNKLAYGPQAMRHVGEQVDRLYWNAGERTVVGDVGEEWAARGCDFRKENIIDQMPSTWSEEAEVEAPAKAAQYVELQTRLEELNVRRREKREVVERYRALKGLLGPFAEGGGVQGNLVTREGEVEGELER